MIFPKSTAINNVMGDVAWTDWSPTYTAGAGTFTTVTTNVAKYRRVGNVIEFFVRATITAIGTASADVRISTPVTGAAASGRGVGRNETSGIVIEVIQTSSLIIAWTKTNTFPVGNGQVFSVRGSYRV